MSIKNDKWIIEQSTKPALMVTERVIEAGNPPSALTLRTRQITQPSHLSVEQLNQMIAARQELERRNPGMEGMYGGVLEYREAYEEDLKDWQPMIEPFESGQCRQYERSGTPEELSLLTSLGAAADKLSKAELGRLLGLEPDKFRFDPMLGLQVLDRAISYGTSSFGYDVRIADEFMIFTDALSSVVDPKNFDDRSFVHFKGDVCVIPPNSFVLARSYEYFRMPRNVSGLVLGKSTYARCGVVCIATPLEPGWEGHITLEYANTTPLPAKLYANEGAAQVQFFEGEQPLVSYADRGGKYQGQRGITLPRA